MGTFCIIYNNYIINNNFAVDYSTIKLIGVLLKLLEESSYVHLSLKWKVFNIVCTSKSCNCNKSCDTSHDKFDLGQKGTDLNN